MMIRTDRLVLGATARLQPLSPAADDALTASIQELGILTPILVRPAPGVTGEPAPIPVNGDNHGFEVVSGYRRVAAARALGMTEVPVEIRELSDLEALAAQIAENTLGKTLHPVDGWMAVRRLMEGGMAEARAARVLGIDVRDLKGMRWLGDLHPAMLDLCRIEMPELRVLRKIAKAPRALQEQTTEIAGIRGFDDDEDTHWVDWAAVDRACTQTRFCRGWLLDPDAADIAWDVDWLAQPGAADEFTTTDRDAFMAAQEAAVAKRLNKKNVRVLADPKSGLLVVPDGYEISWAHDVEGKLPRGYLLGWTVGVSGQIVKRVLAPVAKTVDPDADTDGDGVINVPFGDQPDAPEAERIGTEDDAPDPTKITTTGREIIDGRKDRALKAALMDRDMDPYDLLVFMVLAWCADNVSVQGPDGGRHDRLGIAARIIGPDGNLHPDLPESVINACARTMLAGVLRVSGSGKFGSIPSGAPAEWIGRLAGAEQHLPRFDDLAFLECCRGDALQAVAEAAQVKWSGGVGDMRKRLVDQAPDWRPSQAEFGAAGPGPT